MKKSILTLAATVGLLTATTAYSADVRTINGKNYSFEKDRVVEVTKDFDDKASYGVIGDPHGEAAKAGILANTFKSKGLDGIIIPGDLANNESLRFGKRDSRSDKKEIIDVLEAVAKVDLPVFVIPGNHESKQDYKEALKEITAKYPNVIDMNIYRSFDGDDVDFVSIPGYQTFKAGGRQFIPNDGFYATPKIISDTSEYIKNLDDTIVLIAHGSGKTNTDRKAGPATIYSGIDVGDKNTTAFMNNNNVPFAIVGNIHEAGGYAAGHNGTQVKENSWNRQFSINYGTLQPWKNLDGKVYNGMGGIFEIKGDQAKFQMYRFK